MFRKVLKYDLLFIAKKWWILAATVLGGAIPGAFLLRALIADGGERPTLTVLLGIAAALYLFTYCLVLFGSAAVTAVLLYWRFYAHFYSDEGYLTFTLPVKRRTLLLSKIANEMIWYVANFFLVLLALLIFALFAPPATAQYPVLNPIVFQVIGQVLDALFGAISGGWTVLFLLELLLLLLALVLFSTCLVQLCITVGAVVAKKHKLIAGIGIFYGVNFLLSAVGQILLSFLGTPVIMGLVRILLNAKAGRICTVVFLIFLLFICFMLALAFIAYAITQDKLDRKLNLA